MVYDISGNRIDEGTGGYINYDLVVKGINHRGYNTVAPENTLPAYRLSKKMGFYYVETDVSFTSDNVAMCLHDATIDRTSNGSGTLANMTYEQVRQYDFGSWKSVEYTGTVIPTIAEFLKLCRDIGLHPYIELKNNGNYTQAQIQNVVDLVYQHGLKEKVTYISFSSTYLGYVHSYDATARLGYLSSTASTSDITTINNLKSNNEVFYDVKYSTLTDNIITAFENTNIPIEVWTVDDSNVILSLNSYVSGTTSDNLIMGKVLYDNEMVTD